MTGDTSETVGTATSARPLRPMEILRIRPFAVLYLNATVVFLGVMAQSIARGWLAFELTGSNAALGGVLLAFGVAMLVTTPWGGVVADRLPKRLVLQVSILLLAVSSAWIGLAVAFDVVTYWMLVVAGVLQAVAISLFNPARMAFLAEVVPSNSVAPAVSLLLVNGEVGRVVGPAVAGVLVGAVSYGVEVVFLGSAAMSVLGVVLTGALPPGRRRGAPPTESPLGELVEGVRYVARRPDLSALLWSGVAVVMFGLPYLALLPAVSQDLFDLGSAGYGILSATSAAGAVLTGLLMGRRSAKGRELRVFVASGMVFGLAVAALGVAPTFWVAVVVLAVAGGAQLAFQTVNQSLLLGMSDHAFHGRIQGLVMMGFGAFGIAALPLGALADAVGLRPTLAGMGLAVLLSVAAFALLSRRRMARAELLRDLG